MWMLFFESESHLGYATFSNGKYQKVSSPRNLENCILFVASFNDKKSAEEVFAEIKSNTKIKAKDVEGMAGISSVQVRFMEQLRNKGYDALFMQNGSSILFLPEKGKIPPTTSSWKEYEDLFMKHIHSGKSDQNSFKLK